jgi:hypothetical protein
VQPSLSQGAGRTIEFKVLLTLTLHGRETALGNATTTKTPTCAETRVLKRRRTGVSTKIHGSPTVHLAVQAQPQLSSG